MSSLPRGMRNPKNRRRAVAAPLRDRGGQDVPQAIVGEGKVAIVRIEPGAAAGNVLGEKMSHGRRDDNVSFAVPEEDRYVNVRQAKAPVFSIEQAIGGGAAYAVSERFNGSIG